MKNLIPRLMVLLPLASLHNASAREAFNIHALEIDNPGQPVVDLSAFAESSGQLPGTYRVVVYVNGEKQGEAQDIAFIAGPDQKLNPQLTPAMLKAWGVKTDVFPALAARPQDQPLDEIGRYIPMAAADLIFSKLQLNVSIPQAAMNASARGWVDPSEWDEGVPAALLSYNLSGSNTWREEQKGSDDNYYANLQSGINLGPWRLRLSQRKTAVFTNTMALTRWGFSVPPASRCSLATLLRVQVPSPSSWHVTSSSALKRR
jgi:outer membrane usher protein